MSRAFVKNDADDADVVIPPRAPLPPGTVNYVTPQGLGLLKAELAGLESEREREHSSAGGDAERKRRLTVLAGRIAELSQRIAGAQIVAVPPGPWTVVRFGATVRLRSLDGAIPGEERRFRIVGVDEADAGAGKLAFTAPLALAVLGLGVGEVTVLETAHGAETLEIAGIDYEES